MTRREEQTGEKDALERFELRGRPRPVVRFRRGLIVAITGAVAAGLVVLSWLSLQPRAFHKVAVGATNEAPTSTAPPEALAGAPKDYDQVPRLGPPLPGDLGRPILAHERSLDHESGGHDAESSGQSAAERTRERLKEAEAAARSSPVLVQLGSGDEHRESSVAGQGPDARLDAAPAAGAMPGTASAGQEKVDFARSSEGDLNPDHLRSPQSPYMLTAGTIIPANLITGINSDLPGMVIAQVTSNVRDTITGTIVLVPQGARLIGRYDSIVAFGQRRALLVWNRMIFPDDSSVDLDKTPATDAEGYAGLRGEVDSHTWQLLKGIGLATLLGVGSQLSFGNSRSDLVGAIRESGQESSANAGQQITRQELNVQPTIVVPPGSPVRAILNKDLALKPWSS